MSDNSEWDDPVDDTENKQGMGEDKDTDSFPINSSRPHELSDEQEYPLVDYMPHLTQEDVDEIAESLNEE